MPLEWLFGRKKCPEEMLREQVQRVLNNAMHDLDKERAKMEQHVKIEYADIKDMAKQGKMDVVKVKVLVRTRRYANKFKLISEEIQKIQTLNNAREEADDEDEVLTVLKELRSPLAEVLTGPSDADVKCDLLDHFQEKLDMYNNQEL